MALCSDCSKAEGVVRVGPLTVCPACAEARIRSLEAVAEERARDWQRERIRAEKAQARIAELENVSHIYQSNIEYLGQRAVELEDALRKALKASDTGQARIERLRAVAVPAKQLTVIDRYSLSGGAVILSLMAAFRALQPGDLEEVPDGAQT
jgi:hypothetical protein